MLHGFFSRFAALITPEQIGFNGPTQPTGVAHNLLMQVYFWLGLVAVAMLVYAGYMYTTSNGDPSKVKKAKDGLLYAIIGVVLALMAFVITNFVVQGAS